MRLKTYLLINLATSIAVGLTGCASSSGLTKESPKISSSGTIKDYKGPRKSPDESGLDDYVKQFEYSGFASKVLLSEIVAVGKLDSIQYISGGDDRNLTFNFTILEMLSGEITTQVAVRARSSMTENMSWITNDGQSIIETGLIPEGRLLSKSFLLLLDRELYAENTRINGFASILNHYDLGAAVYLTENGLIYAPDGLIAPQTLDEAKNYISKIRRME